jgi:hypothetical protein
MGYSLFKVSDEVIFFCENALYHEVCVNGGKMSSIISLRTVER